MAGQLVSLAAGGVAYALSFLYPQSPLQSTSSTTAALAKELKTSLSAQAEVCLPGSACFTAATDRWVPLRQPQFDVIVKVAEEQDVAQTVRLANHHDRPFLAISGGHGVTSALEGLRHGVGIWLRELDSIDVLPDGKSARIGGGVLSGDVVHKLWALGKQTVVGACECTGAVAPMLGGGHGWLQGRHGLMADNLLAANVVLGNGTMVTTSAEENGDLFWALRGAGQNFGIVTGFQYRVYDRTPENEKWSYEVMAFEAARAEEVYGAANDMIRGHGRETLPVELVHWSLLLRVPEIDPNNYVILFHLLYQGLEIPKQYSKPLHDLGPIPLQSGTVELPDYAPIAQLAQDSMFCVHGPVIQRYPLSLLSYPIQGIRHVVDILSSLPPSLNSSGMILEAYSMHGVQAVSPEATAHSDRDNNLLIAPMIVSAPGDVEAAEAGDRYGQQLRRAMVNTSGQKLNAYVNYAEGSETTEELYGYEEWRVEKLRRLKREWDPERRFRWYLPL